MCEVNSPPPDCGWISEKPIKRLVAHKARQLCRLPGLTFSDFEDMQQELNLHLFRKAHLFDPSRAGLSTFADRVLDSKASSIARQMRAKKRIFFKDLQSLDAHLADSDGNNTSLVNTVAERALDRKSNRHQIDEPTLKQLRNDVREVSQKAPRHLRTLQSLLGYVSPGTAREVLGISRRQLAQQLQELRGHFQAAGLGA